MRIPLSPGQRQMLGALVQERAAIEQRVKDGVELVALGHLDALPEGARLDLMADAIVVTIPEPVT